MNHRKPQRWPLTERSSSLIVEIVGIEVHVLRLNYQTRPEVGKYWINGTINGAEVDAHYKSLQAEYPTAGPTYVNVHLSCQVQSLSRRLCQSAVKCKSRLAQITTSSSSMLPSPSVSQVLHTFRCVSSLVCHACPTVSCSVHRTSSAILLLA